MANFTMVTTNGDTLEVHGDDVGKARAKGWKLVGPTQESVAPMRQQAARGDAQVRTMGEDLARMIPTAAATGAAMMVPGAQAGAPMLARLALAGRAVGAAGAGGTLGEGLRQALSGRIPSPREMAQEGGRQMAFAVPGEAAAQGAAIMAQPIMRYAWKMSPTKQAAAGANMTATAKEMFPEGEQLWVTALNERVPPSPRVVAGKAKQEAAKKGRALSASVARGDEFTAFDVIRESGIPEIRRKLAMRKDAAPALKELDERVKTFVSQRRLPGNKANQIGPLKRYNAEQLQEELRAWQEEAESVYAAIARTGSGPTTKALDTAIPRGGRRALESKVPELAPINARLQRLARLEDQAKYVQRSGGTFLPILGGIGGSTMGDDPAERIRNATVTALAMRGVTSPGVQGGAALAMTNPIVQRALRETPRWMLPWMFPSDSP